MVQKRRKAGAGCRAPNCGRSRSRKVRANSRRQSKLARVARREERPGKASSQPAVRDRLGTGLLNVQSGQLPERDAARERLARLAQELRGGRSQDQESRRVPHAVEEDAERGEQLGTALDFVEHDQAAQTFEGGEGILQARQMARVLEIEAGHRVPTSLGVLAGEGCFANLAGAENRHRRRMFEGCVQGSKRSVSFQHGSILV